MRIHLSEIAQASIALINRQLGEDYNKYIVEEEFQWSAKSSENQNNLMPKIIFDWGVSSSEILLITCCPHDMDTRALSYASIEELEKAILGNGSFLNPFTAYVIPIIYGKVSDFDVVNRKGEVLIKEKFIENEKSFDTKELKVIWKK